MNRCIALLRGVNVGGRNKLPMVELREVAAGCGFENARTYIQSGNLAFSCACAPDVAAARLRERIMDSHELDIPVLVRTAEAWTAALSNCPWPDAAVDREKQIHIGVATSSPPAGADALLMARARGAERVHIVGDVVWLDFSEGVARSKLTSAYLDRVCGGTVTLRNFRTAQKIASML